MIGAAAGLAHSQTAAGPADPAAATIPIQPLTKYVIPNQTASVMLPAGWQVTRTGIAMIRAQGPNGEIAMFGILVPARDAPPAGGDMAVGAPLSQPYAANLSDKFMQSAQWVRDANGQGPVQVKIMSQKPFEAPPVFGNCSTMTATLGVPGMGMLAAETDFCSMPVDSAGNYRNFFKLVAISPALVATERGTMEAMLASYRLNMKAVQRELANQNTAQQAGQGPGSNRGFTASPSRGAAPGGMQPTPAAANGLPPQMQQMVQMMRAQAAAQLQMKAANMINETTTAQLSSSLNGADYFDRSILRGQIPVTLADQPVFWIDPN
jgi:hypothetical protein